MRDSNESITGLPAGSPRTSVVPEVRNQSVEKLIELRGERLAWTRAGACPCSHNAETDQPDPTCSLCNGLGWFYFAPREYNPTDKGELTTVQQAILDDSGAVVIKGATQRAIVAQTPYTGLGNWRTGQLMVSVRGENRLGYYDRLVNLDREICYYEIVEVPADEAVPIRLRYRASGINIVRSLDTVYAYDAEYQLTPRGELEFFPGLRPPPGTTLGVHYLMHPTFLVTDYPHATRGTTALRRRTPRVSPTGNPQILPIQAEIRLEFVPDSG